MLNSGQFRPGQYVLLGDDIGNIRLFDTDLVVISLKNGGVKHFNQKQIHEFYTTKQLQFLAKPTDSKPRVIEGISEFDTKKLERKLAYLKALDDYPSPNATGIRELVIDKISTKLNDNTPPSVSTLSRWYRDWIKQGKDPLADYEGKSIRRSRIEESISNLMDEVIQDVYLVRNKPTINRAYRFFINRLNSLGYSSPYPSIKTFSRTIKKLDKYDVISAREGRVVARAEARVANRKIEVDFPLGGPRDFASKYCKNR